MTAHTPGPWRWRNEPYDDGDPYIIIDAGPNPFGFNHAGNGGFRIAGIFSEADARLIASAPEMLEALKQLTDACGCVRPLSGDVSCEKVSDMRRAMDFM